MFDGQVVRPPQRFRDLAKDYVCVRIVNINDFDLNLYPFDYDLTLAIVLANADGTVYHRYGGRDHISPMNMETLLDVMKEGLVTHRRYEPSTSPAQPERKPPMSVAHLIENRLQGRIQATFGCYHCHYAREARQQLALEAGAWTPDQFWIWPGPDRLGLVMDQRRQNTVAEVAPGSAADNAGFRKGDRLQTLDGRRILTKYDIQWALEQSPGEPTVLSYQLQRDKGILKGTLQLEEAWKVGDPKDYLWRVRNVFTEHMTKFLPTAGFMGKTVSEQDLVGMGLSERGFALRITHLNHGTYLAGVRLGDVVLSVAGRSDFDAMRDFHHWCERLRRAGRDIKMEIYRQGARMNVMVSLEHLNYSRVAKAPRVLLGFIAQELPGDSGLRVGHVTDDSGAEKTGLLLGDRIVAVDGQKVGTRKGLEAILNNKSPGDVLTFSVQRDGKPLFFGYTLPGEDEQESDLARLSERVTRKGQQLTCVVTIKLPPGDHIYSVHKKGFGVPTQLEFRGRGYRLVGEIEEPPPKELRQEGLETMWVLSGAVKLQQVIEVIDPAQFQLLLSVYAQVCDDKRCYQFRSVIVNDGRAEKFAEYHGRFEKQPRIMMVQRDP